MKGSYVQRCGISKVWGLRSLQTSQFNGYHKPCSMNTHLLHRLPHSISSPSNLDHIIPRKVNTTFAAYIHGLRCGGWLKSRFALKISFNVNLLDTPILSASWRNVCQVNPLRSSIVSGRRCSQDIHIRGPSWAQSAWRPPDLKGRKGHLWMGQRRMV